MKRLTIVPLLAALALQAGCYNRSDPLGRPVPGSSAARMIRQADRIEVTTLSGRRYGLLRPEVDSMAIRGVVRHSNHWELEIPLDSIAGTEIVTLDGLRTTLLSVGLGIAVLGLIMEAVGGIEPSSRNN